jgi:hypothetical protein
MGWRYLMYTMGAMIFVMSLLRITVIRLKETPKFLLGQVLAGSRSRCRTRRQPPRSSGKV